MSTLIVYNGDPTFQDLYEPVATKNEWGMDVLNRVMSGSQPNLKAFVQSLAQGQTFVFNFQTWYLQTWECDNDRVFPKVGMIYKGLFSGIPAPFVTGRTVEQTSSQTTATPVSISYWDVQSQSNVTKDVMGTRNTRYQTRESSYKYITTVRPTFPTYEDLDVAFSPEPIQSIITTDAGPSYTTNAPAALATALAPAIVNRTTTNTMPVFGSPYFENEDNVVQYWE